MSGPVTESDSPRAQPSFCEYLDAAGESNFAKVDGPERALEQRLRGQGLYPVEIWRWEGPLSGKVDGGGGRWEACQVDLDFAAAPTLVITDPSGRQSERRIALSDLGEVKSRGWLFRVLSLSSQKGDIALKGGAPGAMTRLEKTIRAELSGKQVS